MNNILSLLSWQFALFSLCVFGVVFVIRTVLEFAIANLNSKKWWRDLVMPLAPMLVGSLLAVCVASFPYPEGLVSASARMIFGFVAGLLSGIVYRVVKAIAPSGVSSTVVDGYEEGL